MAKGKYRNEFDEIDHIKSDLQSLKTNVVALTQHLKDNGAEHLVDLEGKAKKKFTKLSVEGQRRYKEVEDHVRENPGQSILIAFAGGILASYLMSGRRG